MNIRAAMASMLIAVAGVGCASAEKPAQARDADACKPSVDLRDPQYKPAVVGTDGWDYEEKVSGDLNNDGAPETVHVIAQAPADAPKTGWDDSQPWQVFIEGGGQRTYVFAQRIQLGGLDAAITPEGLVLHVDANSVADYLVTYRGPGRSKLTRR